MAAAAAAALPGVFEAVATVASLVGVGVTGAALIRRLRGTDGTGLSMGMQIVRPSGAAGAEHNASPAEQASIALARRAAELLMNLEAHIAKKLGSKSPFDTPSAPLSALEKRQVQERIDTVQRILTSVLFPNDSSSGSTPTPDPDDVQQGFRDEFRSILMELVNACSGSSSSAGFTESMDGSCSLISSPSFQDALDTVLREMAQQRAHAKTGGMDDGGGSHSFTAGSAAPSACAAAAAGASSGASLPPSSDSVEDEYFPAAADAGPLSLPAAAASSLQPDNAMEDIAADARSPAEAAEKLAAHAANLPPLMLLQPYVCAVACKLAYAPHQARAALLGQLNAQLGHDWRVYSRRRCFLPGLLVDEFECVTLVSDQFRVLLHASRGTDASLVANLADDALLALGVLPSGVSKMLRYMQKLEEHLNEHDVHRVQYTHVHTGHSLAAVVAQLTALLLRRESRFVGFDSPGTSPLVAKLRQLFTEYLAVQGRHSADLLAQLFPSVHAGVREMPEWIAGMSAVLADTFPDDASCARRCKTYNAAPNFINTCHAHVGALSRLHVQHANPLSLPEEDTQKAAVAVVVATLTGAGVPWASLGSLLAASLGTYTMRQHGIDNIIDAFDSATGFPLLEVSCVSWPGKMSYMLFLLNSYLLKNCAFNFVWMALQGDGFNLLDVPFNNLRVERELLLHGPEGYAPLAVVLPPEWVMRCTLMNSNVAQQLQLPLVAHEGKRAHHFLKHSIYHAAVFYLPEDAVFQQAAGGLLSLAEAAAPGDASGVLLVSARRLHSAAVADHAQSYQQIRSFFSLGAALEGRWADTPLSGVVRVGVMLGQKLGYFTDAALAALGKDKGNKQPPPMPVAMPPNNALLAAAAAAPAAAAAAAGAHADVDGAPQVVNVEQWLCVQLPAHLQLPPHSFILIDPLPARA